MRYCLESHKKITWRFLLLFVLIPAYVCELNIEIGSGNAGEVGSGNAGEVGSGNAEEVGSGNAGEVGSGNAYEYEPDRPESLSAVIWLPRYVLPHLLDLEAFKVNETKVECKADTGNSWPHFIQRPFGLTPALTTRCEVLSYNATLTCNVITSFASDRYDMDFVCLAMTVKIYDTEIIPQEFER